MDQLPEITVDTTKAVAKKATATLKSAGSLIAKKTEQATLVTVTLPRVYAELGKATFKNAGFREEYAEMFRMLGELLAERKTIHDTATARPTGSTLAEKVKKLAGDATDLARTKAIDLKLHQAFARLGEAVYQRHGDRAGPPPLVAPVATAVRKREQLEKELAAIDAQSQGSWITPKRLVLVGGMFLGLCIVLGFREDLARQRSQSMAEPNRGSTASAESVSEEDEATISRYPQLKVIQGMGYLDRKEIAMFRDYMRKVEGKGSSRGGENALLLMMVPSSEWREAATKLGMTDTEFQKAVNFVRMMSQQ